jgi:hypothetical protein
MRVLTWFPALSDFDQGSMGVNRHGSRDRRAFKSGQISPEVGDNPACGSRKFLIRIPADLSNELQHHAASDSRFGSRRVACWAFSRTTVKNEPPLKQPASFLWSVSH